MSVVNKMLRDLDKRENIRSYTPYNATYIAPKSSKRFFYTSVCIGILSLCTIAYLFFVNGESAPEEHILRTHTANEVQEIEKIASSKDEAATNEYVAEIIDTPEDKRVIEHRNSNSNNALTTALTPEKVELVSKTIENVPTKNIVKRVAAVKDTISPEQISVESTSNSKVSFSVAPSDGAKSQLSSLRAQAHMASEKNDDAEVAQILQEILVIAPKEIKIRKQLAALLFSKNQLDSAKEVLKVGIEQEPSNSSLRLMLSRIYYRLGDLKTAYSVLAEHPYSALANDELVSFRAALAEKTGNYSFAQQDYLLLVQRNPNDAKWWLGLGVSQDKQQMSEKAISSYQNAQSLKQLPQQVDTFVAKRIELLARSS